MALERHALIEPTHPGAFLAERQPVTPTLAAKLGKLFGNGSGLWIRMQAEHDVWRATTEVDVSAIETFAFEAAE